MRWSRRPRRGEDEPLSWSRALTIVVLLGVFYFVAPFGQNDDPLPLALAVGLALLTVTGLALLVVRRILRLIENPTEVDLPTLTVLLFLTVVAFAAAYFMLQRSDQGQVAGLDTRLDSLYMTLTTVTTVGFGDVHPVGQTARALACMQLVFNAVFIGTLLRTVGMSIGQHRRFRQQAPSTGHVRSVVGGEGGSQEAELPGSSQSG